MPHRLNCVVNAEHHYSVWFAGQLLVQDTTEPLAEALRALRLKGVQGNVELWSPDKPWTMQVGTVQ